MTVHTRHWLGILPLPPLPGAALDEATRQLARDISQQFVEINTTDSVDSTTVAAKPWPGG
jgi:hypothetical protein